MRARCRRVRLVLVGLAVAALPGCVRLGTPDEPADAADAVADAQARIDDMTWAQALLLDRVDFNDAWAESDDTEFRAVSSRSLPAVLSCLGVAGDPTATAAQATSPASTMAQIAAQGTSNVFFRQDYAYAISAGLVTAATADAETLFGRTGADGFGQCVAERSDSAGTATSAPTASAGTTPAVGDESAAFRLRVTQLRKGVPVPYGVDMSIVRSSRALSILFVARPDDGMPIVQQDLDALVRSMAARIEVHNPDTATP